MKSAAWIIASSAAALLVTAGCENTGSKLDEIAKPAPAPSGGSDTSGLAARVAQLEARLAAREEALQFLDVVYQQQKQREQQQEEEKRSRPQPGVVYGVDIQQNLDLGQVEGSRDALVTIVEAFDFA